MLFNEHDDDPNEAYKVLPGLPGLLREAHTLPPEVAREVQSFWAKAQDHDALVDRIKRAYATQSSERDKLRNDLKASWPVLVEAVRSALQAVENYTDESLRDEPSAGVAFEEKGARSLFRTAKQSATKYHRRCDRKDERQTT